LNLRAFLVRGIHKAWQRKGVLSTLLLPLAGLTRLAIALRKQRAGARPAARPAGTRPVVVVGNLLVGGTGKTPVVMAVVQSLLRHGWHPGVVSRGYGVRIEGEPRVGQGRLDAAAYGDEPALIARATGAPIAAHPRRVRAIQALVHAYPDVDVIVSDDGLQHLAMQRDLEIVVQDARGLGNGRVLPAGPLREPGTRLQTVDYLVTNLAPGQSVPEIAETPAASVAMRLAATHARHLLSGERMTWPEWRTRHARATVAAVAAIGQPERFFVMLRDQGLTLSQTLALPDHHAYPTSPFVDLQADAILITAKDAVKCAHFEDPRLWVVEAEPHFSDPGWLDDLCSRLAIIAEKKKSDSIKLSD